MFSLLLAATALFSVSNGQTTATCESFWGNTQQTTCSQLQQYENACNTYFTCVKGAVCDLYNSALQQSLGGLLSDYANCTAGTTCRGYYCNENFVQYYADVVGCTCAFLTELGAPESYKTSLISQFSSYIDDFCDGSLSIGCSGSTATVTLPRWKVSFRLSIASWNWSAYTQAQFEAFKERLREYIAKRLAVWKSQVTITWTYQGSSGRRLLQTSASVGVSVELGTQDDATYIQTQASDSSFTTDLSSELGLTVTESESATTSDDTQAFRGDATRNAMTIVTMFAAIAGFMLQ